MRNLPDFRIHYLDRVAETHVETSQRVHSTNLAVILASLFLLAIAHDLVTLPSAWNVLGADLHLPAKSWVLICLAVFVACAYYYGLALRLYSERLRAVLSANYHRAGVPDGGETPHDVMEFPGIETPGTVAAFTDPKSPISFLGCVMPLLVFLLIFLFPIYAVVSSTERALRHAEPWAAVATMFALIILMRMTLYRTLRFYIRGIMAKRSRHERPKLGPFELNEPGTSLTG